MHLIPPHDIFAGSSSRVLVLRFTTSVFARPFLNAHLLRARYFAILQSVSVLSTLGAPLLCHGWISRGLGINLCATVHQATWINIFVTIFHTFLWKWELAADSRNVFHASWFTLPVDIRTPGFVKAHGEACMFSCVDSCLGETVLI